MNIQAIKRLAKRRANTLLNLFILAIFFFFFASSKDMSVFATFSKFVFFLMSLYERLTTDHWLPSAPVETALYIPRLTDSLSPAKAESHSLMGDDHHAREGEKR